MNSEEITVNAGEGGQFSAYVVKPDAVPAPGLVIIQEIFGVNQVMRGLAQSYASQGYIAIVPDLFWRQEPGLQLDDHSEADLQKAFELYAGFDEDKGVEDLQATFRVLKDLPDCTGKVGSVGYCLGGKLAYLMGSRSETDCDVSYYGVGIENNLNELAAIQRPFILHLAEKDEFVPEEAQSTIKAAFNYHPGVTLYSYEGVNHAFAREGGDNYAPETAEVANRRTREFFKKHLFDE